MFCKCWHVFRQSPRQEQADDDFDPLADPPSLFPWAAVALGVGICLFFILRFEPASGLLWASFAAGIALVLWIRSGRVPWGMRSWTWALALIAIGFSVAGYRAHSVAAPVLASRYYGPIEGRITAIDISASQAVRLTLDQVFFGDTAPWRTPAKVRISMHGTQGYFTPQPGQFVMTTGHLSPPQGPVEPYGFDFRRMAWFQRLGAVGYTRNPVLLSAPAGRAGFGMAIYNLRLKLSHGIQNRLNGPRGAFASAIITGDRAGLDPQLVTNLRQSNLAHLLAISGLHMGLLTGLVFYIVRAGLALFPYIALHWPTRKIAAVAALCVGMLYLGLSGANIATQRAFIMVAVMFVALLFDRRALSLRSVAMAALILMMWRPEAVLGAGFQMSFAATTALIVGFNALRLTAFHQIPKLFQPVAMLVASSLMAGLATAPFAAAHFNIVASYGLLANLLAVPAMGAVVMPGALISALLTPFGAEFLGLWLMGLGIDWILWVAEFVAGLEGGVRFVPMPNRWVLPLCAAGGLCVMLGPYKVLRLFGVFLFATGIVLWSNTQRPDLLMSQSGALIGVRGADGLILSKERGEGFAARNWLQNDGDVSEQGVAYARAGFTHSRAQSEFAMRDMTLRFEDQTEIFRLIQLRGKTASEIAQNHCETGVLIIALRAITPPAGPCQIIDGTALRTTGSIAVYHSKNGAHWVTSQQVSGQRLWTNWRHD